MSFNLVNLQSYETNEPDTARATASIFPAESRGKQMKKRPQSREDVPWSKRQEIPDPQVLDAADQYEEARKLLAEQPPGSGVLLPLMNTAAIAVELYLKRLAAELIHVEDEQMPEVSRVYAEPARRGHNLVALLDAMPPDVRCSLINAFRSRWNKDLQRVLTELEGAILATRYPFERGIDITCYNLEHLMGLADFLGRFARSVPPTDRIEWK